MVSADLNEHGKDDDDGDDDDQGDDIDVDDVDDGKDDYVHSLH